MSGEVAWDDVLDYIDQAVRYSFDLNPNMPTHHIDREAE